MKKRGTFEQKNHECDVGIGLVAGSFCCCFDSSRLSAVHHYDAVADD